MRAAAVQHLGVLCILIALSYLSVRFMRLPPELYLLVAPLYFLYLGVALIFAARGNRRRNNIRRGKHDRRRVRVLVLAFLLLFSAIPASDVNASVSPDHLQEAARMLTVWFTELLGHFAGLVEAEKKLRLVEALDTLKESLYDVEQSKRHLVQEIRHRSLADSELNQVVTELESKVASTRANLRAAGLSMREQFRLGGDKAEKQLAEALDERKNWIVELRSRLPLNSVDAERYAVRGQAVVEDLQRANQALIVLVAKLKELPTSE